MREAGLALATACLAFALLTHFSGSMILRQLETASLDLRFQLRGVSAPPDECTIVLIDDRSVAAFGRWPISRTVFAKAVDLLTRAGAKAIVFDVGFGAPEEPAPAAWQAAVRAAANALADSADAALRDSLQRLARENPDAELAAAFAASGRVLITLAAYDGRPPDGQKPDLSTIAFQNDTGLLRAPAGLGGYALLPIAPLAKAAAGLGHVTIELDLDGAPRYELLALPANGVYVPSLSLRAAAALLGIPWSAVRLEPGRGVAVGSDWVPTGPAMDMLVNYRGPRRTFRTVTFLDLVEGRVPDALLRGRLVLIGASLSSNPQSYGSPFDNTLRLSMPGIERFANVVDTIVHRRFISENPPPWPTFVTAAVIVLAMLMAAAALLPMRAAAFATLAPILAWCAFAQIAFLNGIWIPVVAPLGTLASVAIVLALFRYWIVEREGREIKSAFRHYLAPAVVNDLAAHPERLQLGGETRPMTLLFSDVRGFTSISEHFKSNPQGLTRLINRFLTPMTDLVMARGGTIDKYIGDCIMAFWNAPLDDQRHADHACESALAMLGELERVNRDLKAEAEAEGRPFYELRVGVGINTGECVVGNMGSDQRFDYSVLGDAVNLASRLEGQSKTYQVSIVIGEDTRAAAPSWAALELDLIEVKGKHDAVRIYTVLGDGALAASPEFAALSRLHDMMLGCYRAQDWAGARAALAQCRGRDPRLEGLYNLYEQRIAANEASPPGPDWRGVFVAESK
ncbi:MAG TPA: adenylate/guanylate cyclase domain-containing protein [Stellaceae bacterium]|nr:adenylate/guanylate cyclase domain-containing protein [Stellaceae bacterium]